MAVFLLFLGFIIESSYARRCQIINILFWDEQDVKQGRRFFYAEIGVAYFR